MKILQKTFLVFLMLFVVGTTISKASYEGTSSCSNPCPITLVTYNPAPAVLFGTTTADAVYKDCNNCTLTYTVTTTYFLFCPIYKCKTFVNKTCGGGGNSGGLN